MNKTLRGSFGGWVAPLWVLASITTCGCSRILRAAHIPGQIPKEMVVVADTGLPPVLLSDIPIHASTTHSRHMGMPHGEDHLTLIVRKKGPRKMIGIPQVRAPVHHIAQEESKHQQELEELDRVFHHVEEEHLKAFEEHHRDPIKTHYSLDASGRIKHVTVDEEIPVQQTSGLESAIHHEAWDEMHEHEEPSIEEKAELAAIERMEHEQLIGDETQNITQEKQKTIDDLLWEDHKLQVDEAPSEPEKVDLEKVEWQQEKKEKKRNFVALTLGLVVIAVLFAAVLIKLLPMYELFGKLKKQPPHLKRKASIDPQPWRRFDSRYGDPTPRSPMRRPTWLRRDRSPERDSNSADDSIL